MTCEPLRIIVTGAAGQIGYSILYMLASGDVLGPNQPMHLVLFDIAPMLPALGGVEMELQDCSFPLLCGVTCTADENVAFKDVDICIMVGAMPRREGMERKDLLAANVRIFKGQGAALDRLAKKTVKVVVAGNPANTNAFICSKYAPSIPKENFSALTRLDHNRAIAQLARKAGVQAKDVSNAIIWGNHSSTQYPDASHASVKVGGSAKPASEVIKDDAWLRNDFVKTVQSRGAAVIQARKLSSAMSAAKAISDHLRDWIQGTKPGQFVSMAVPSDGSYGIEKGLMFSFPVKIEAGKWSIVKDLKVDSFSQEMFDATTKELVEERDIALSTCQD